MNVFYSFEDIPYNKSTVLSIGTFDGVHRAHQAILQSLLSYAQDHVLRHLVITFEPHPQFVVNQVSPMQVLTTLNEKLLLFEKVGVETVLVVQFNKEFSQIKYHDFYSEYIVKRIGVAAVIEGYNHRFGKDRQGSVSELCTIGKEFGFEVMTVDPIRFNGQPISSTRIRKALIESDIWAANEMLGYPYFLTGTVVEGDKRGRMLGYPTANIRVPSAKLIPHTGIYVSRVTLEKQHSYGLTSIGYRPTFSTNGTLHIETYIYDFSETIYGKELKIELLHRLRDEQKFDSIEQLIEQMNKDKEIGYSIIQQFRDK
ncbi:MAG: bifunctional riboflavin kinase/FAD synthetase [Bacteroidetes bacterium]|nr:bifunctional riboflavin kinase/FAD synthetase [Bacteroidota bacterium]